MSGITAIFGNQADKSPPGDERLLDLYWNRNELKKEFAGLRNEKFRLTDRLKAQQGDLARMQQKLEHLEELLIDPEWARSILVLYQLRGLGRRCSGRVARFAEQIKQQRENKQNRRALNQWRMEIRREVDRIDAEIRGIREQRQDLEEELGRAEGDLARMSGLLRLLRRRSARRRVDELAGRIRELEEADASRRADRERAADREPPEIMGLTLAAKRSVNFMILSYAQQLYISFGDDDLVSLVKEACDKSAGAVRYGSDRDCEALIRRIRRSADSLSQSADFAEEMQKRARLISEGALYKNDDDAVPLPGSVATLIRIGPDDAVVTGDADLLGQNYWGLADVLSR